MKEGREIEYGIWNREDRRRKMKDRRWKTYGSRMMLNGRLKMEEGKKEEGRWNTTMMVVPPTLTICKVFFLFTKFFVW